MKWFKWLWNKLTGPSKLEILMNEVYANDQKLKNNLDKYNDRRSYFNLLVQIREEKLRDGPKTIQFYHDVNEDFENKMEEYDKMGNE